MGARIGMVNLLVQESESVAKVNAILHECAKIVIGRLGLPYKERGIHAIISLVVDGTSDDISAMTGKLGKVDGIIVKSVMNRL